MIAASSTARPKMTLEEWANLPDDEPGELVNGELVEEEQLGADHRWIHALDLSEGKSPVPGCDDLEIDVDELWREVERAVREDG